MSFISRKLEKEINERENESLSILTKEIPALEKHTHTVAIVSVTLATLIAGVFFYFFTLGKMSDLEEGALVQPVKQGSVDTIVCNYADDISASKVAQDTNDLKTCLCIKDETLKNLCEENIRDSLTYKSALKQLDVRLCDSLIVEARKEGCVAVIENSIAYFEKEDPKRLAAIFSMSHNNDEAILQYEELLESDPDNIEYLKNVALAYAEKGLKEQELGRDQTPFVEKALVAIEKAKSIDENNSDVYRVMGYVYEIQPNLLTALTWYEKAIELDPRNIAAYAGKGHTERMLGMLDLAIEDFKKAAELDSTKVNVFIYTNLCNLEESQKNFDEAEKYCKIVAESSEIDSVFKSGALQTLSMIAREKREYSLANSYLIEAQTITPSDTNLLVSFSKLRFYEEKYDDAIEYAQKAIQQSPTKALAYLALAQAFYMQDKNEESINIALEGVAIVDKDVSLLNPSKPVTRRDFFALIAFNFREMGDTENQTKFENLAREAMK